MMKIKSSELKKWLLDACLFEADAISAYPTVTFEHSREYNERIREILSEKNYGGFSRTRTAKIIIISAIIISLLLSALACIPIIKKYIISRTESDYWVSVNPDAKDDETEIFRSTIDDVYLPSYIPDGYFEVQSTNNEFTVSSLWMNDVNVITYDQWGNDGAYSIDSQASYNIIKIADYDINYSIKHEYKNMFWEHDGYIFILTCPDSIGFDEVEKIIESIQKNPKN